jgi:hypothetical protein
LLIKDEIPTHQTPDWGICTEDLYEQVGWGVRELFNRAYSGDNYSIRKLAEILNDGAQDLQVLAKTFPERVTDVAKRHASWAVNIYPSKVEITKVVQMCEALRVGTESGLRTGQRKKLDLQHTVAWKGKEVPTWLGYAWGARNAFHYNRWRIPQLRARIPKDDPCAHFVCRLGKASWVSRHYCCGITIQSWQDACLMFPTEHITKDNFDEWWGLIGKFPVLDRWLRETDEYRIVLQRSYSKQYRFKEAQQRNYALNEIKGAVLHLLSLGQP